MGFSMKASSGGDFETPAAGSQPAVLVGLIELGTQQEEYQGQTKEARKVFLVWELTGEKKSDGSNFVIGRDYTQSLNQMAALRKVVEKWRGREMQVDEEFDLTKLIGKPCLLSLVHKTSQGGKTYAKIDGVQAVPKGMAVPPATRKPIVWAIDGGQPIPDAD